MKRWEDADAMLGGKELLVKQVRFFVAQHFTRIGGQSSN
jgi:hypothetical protein